MKKSYILMPLLLIAILTAGCKQKEDIKDSDIVAISEAVAETDEELMMKYLEGEETTAM